MPAPPQASEGQAGPAPGHQENAEGAGDDLADHGGRGRSGDSHGRAAEQAEDHDGIQDHIDHAADSHHHQGRRHMAGGLKDLFGGDMEQLAEGKDHDDVAVGVAHGADGRIVCVHTDEGRDEQTGEPRQDDVVEDGQDHADGRRVVGGFRVSGAHVPGNVGVQSHARAHSQGQGKILDRENDGNGGEGGVLCFLTEDGFMTDVPFFLRRTKKAIYPFVLNQKTKKIYTKYSNILYNLQSMMKKSCWRKRLY